ncbi:uncharacterized protein [Rutidosis leptorrhynchoides]|uniref:uncharacterized protein n=1 Tax=Rutidosis leptorrhynchoides TaxID=125765 RepID=UPI003A99352E
MIPIFEGKELKGGIDPSQQSQGLNIDGSTSKEAHGCSQHSHVNSGPIKEVGVSKEKGVKTNKGKGKNRKVEKRKTIRQEGGYKKRVASGKCPWLLHIFKVNNSETWQVRTYKEEHKCLNSRDIKQCTYEFIASQLQDQLATNPRIPTKAVKHQYESKLDVNISRMKAYRALKKATKNLEGDYHSQYSLLRDYLEELVKCNPGTRTKVVTEPSNSNSRIRVFKRVYICLGALKRGFRALGRDLIGLDGCFMKEPARGQVLTAVGMDSNNGIYPVAYAIVEAENFNSWKWFLENLGEDLDLDSRSNYTFISDRQKGLIGAVDKIFPSAEHRYYLRHIHENLKSNKWNGLAFKQYLWRCATATTVPEFERCMEALKEFNAGCHKYLADIGAHHWTRSHFTGRAITDVLLNNMCEILNRWLVDGRDKPIITALEFIREYLMKRIVNVLNHIDKCQGPLTPSATKVFEGIKKEASKYTLMFNGGHKYQVNGPHNDQCVVDMEQKVCGCRKWELTGMPCKHVVVVLNNMAFNGSKVGPLESWVHKVHWLATWKMTYNFHINPIHGRAHWSKSQVPSQLLPPLKVATAGRPKKNRRKSVNEEESLNKGGKLSKKGKSSRCGKCREFGHNQRSCTNEGSVGGKKRKSAASGSGTNKKSKA